MRIRSGAAGFCVTAALAALTTAGFSWVAVAFGWSAGTMVMLVLPLCRRRWEGNSTMPAAFGVAVMTAAALGAERAFPADSTFPFVSIMLLLLLWRALCGESEGPGRVTAVLGLILLPVFASTLLLGFQEISWREAVSGGASWEQALISIGAASPWWALEELGRDARAWRWYGVSAGTSLGLSLLTHGALGSELAETARFPLYRAVQTVHLIHAQHAEALVAAAVLLGSFGILLTAGEMTVHAVKKDRAGAFRWKIGGILGTVFLLEWMIRGVGEKVGHAVTTVFWALIPLGTLWVVFAQKKKK